MRVPAGSEVRHGADGAQYVDRPSSKGTSEVSLSRGFELLAREGARTSEIVGCVEEHDVASISSVRGAGRLDKTGVALVKESFCGHKTQRFLPCINRANEAPVSAVTT